MTNCSDSELACRTFADAAAENDARGLAGAVRQIFARPFLLALALCVAAQGCVVIPGVEPTDLSVVEGHPSVGEIEKVLGEPLEIRTAETGEERIYAFDVGAEGVAEFAPGLVFTPGELVFLWITTPFGIVDTYNGQREVLTVRYDHNGNAFDFGTPMTISAPRSAIHSVYGEPDETRTANGRHVDFFNKASQNNFLTYGPDDMSEFYLIAKDYWQKDKIFEYLTGPDDLDSRFQLGSHLAPETRWNWYCRIAHQGHGEASSKIGFMYRWGHEPHPKDQVQAYKWYSIAAREGHSPSASSLAWVERDMTPDEVLKAERLAAEWKPNPDECDVFLKANAEAQ